METYVSCTSSEACPAIQPECRTFAHDGRSGAFCTRACVEAADCHYEGAVGSNGCVKVDAAGEHDPVNGEGICVRLCDPGQGDCGNETIYECVPVSGDPDLLALCVPL